MTTERMNELFNSKNATLAICVGSWKAYNECNDHSLGTCYKGRFYIDFGKLESEEELYEVLDFLGWSKLEQEELFIQDYSGDIEFGNCDYIHPATIIRAIIDNNIDIDRDLTKISAIMEHESMSFEDACEKADDYAFYEDKTAEEYLREVDEDYYESVLDKAGLGFLRDYITIDWEQLARDSDYLYEIQGGVLTEC